MADRPRNADTGEDTGEESDQASTTGTSRWQKVVGIIGIVVILLVVVLRFGVGGEHGPGRHDPRGDTPGVEDGARPEGGHAPPAGRHGMQR